MTNGTIAEILGISGSTVTRLRNGERLPSLYLMQRIEDTLNWEVQSQSNARKNGIWTETFNRLVEQTDERE